MKVTSLAFLLCLTALPAMSGLAFGAEFYSWRDASGMMVLTDDPGRIPPASKRGDIAVYSFPDRPASQARSDQGVRLDNPLEASAEEIYGEPEPMPGRYQTAQQVEPIDPAESVQPQYVWVPFTVPVYLGGGAVSGFWCHRGAGSPALALKQFLGQHEGLVRTLGDALASPPRSGGMTYHRPLSPLPATSGNPVYDQILREQHAMIERLYSRPAAFHPGPHPGKARSGFSR